MAKPVRVYCETLDIWFNTIKDAAKYAKVDAWSIKPNKKAKTPDFVFADLPKVVQELINKTATDMILQERPWHKVKSFLRSMGAKQLVLTLGDEDAE